MPRSRVRPGTGLVGRWGSAPASSRGLSVDAGVPGQARDGVGRGVAGGTGLVMGETRPRICGVKTVQWTVFRVERPRTLEPAG